MTGVTAAEAVLARTAGTPMPRVVIAAAAIRVFSDLMRFLRPRGPRSGRQVGPFYFHDIKNLDIN
jgi:hypothetical protein